MNLPLLNIPSEYYWLVLTLCAVFITFFLIRLLSSLARLANSLRKTSALLNERLKELSPLLEHTTRVEKKICETLSVIDFNMEKLDSNLTRLTDEICATLKGHQDLEKSLEDRINQDFSPILQETRELVSEANQVARNIQNKMEAAQGIFDALDEAGSTLKDVTQILGGGLTGFAIQVASMAAGLKRSLEYIGENFHKKEAK